MVKKARDKQSKKWISIQAPKEFNNADIGETYVYDLSECKNKVIKVNLMTLTRDPKKQNSEVTFKLTDCKENKAHTVIEGYQILTSHLKRVAKKSKLKYELSFLSETKDKVKIRIKPVILAKSYSTRSVTSALIKETENIVKDIASKTEFNNLIKAIIDGYLQKDIKNRLQKIYPINSCVIKAVKKL